MKQIRYIVETQWSQIDTDSLKEFIHYIYKFGRKNIKDVRVYLRRSNNGRYRVGN